MIPDGRGGNAGSLMYRSMIKQIIALLFLCSVALTSYTQPLRDINYEYLYNPDAPFIFELKPVRGQEFYTLLYSFQVKDTVGLRDQYTLEWEGRTLLSDQEGTSLVLQEESRTRNPWGFSGRGKVSRTQAPQYIVARVIHKGLNRAWLFYTTLTPEFPVNDFLVRDDGSPVVASSIHPRETVRIASGTGPWIVSYYDDDFPAAAPAFSEAQARVSPVIRADSVYHVSGDGSVNFPRRGLYLLQKDTLTVEGFAIRAEDDYPQYTRLPNLAGPLIYISTRQEYERLSASKGNKRVFDRVILSITSDPDRARNLMRMYFRRVELANRYFTSYKEGWKTDRGMIYIIFGKPDQVFRFNDREVWNYELVKIRFNFTRSSSLFDPDNYVLLRESRFEGTWYEVIDLWRNARF